MMNVKRDGGNYQVAIERVGDDALDRLKRMTVYAWQAFTTVVSKPNSRPYTRTPPGDPPRLRTGFGRASIKYEIDEKLFKARVGIGSAGKYMAFQELSKRLNHPWMGPTLRTIFARLQAIAREGGKS